MATVSIIITFIIFKSLTLLAVGTWIAYVYDVLLDNLQYPNLMRSIKDVLHLVLAICTFCFNAGELIYECIRN